MNATSSPFTFHDVLVALLLRLPPPHRLSIDQTELVQAAGFALTAEISHAGWQLTARPRHASPCCNNPQVPQERRCDACFLLDRDESVKPCTWCEWCQAWLCVRCQRDPFRRVRAAGERIVRKFLGEP